MACEIEKMASNTDHRPLLATVLMYLHEIWKNMICWIKEEMYMLLHKIIKHLCRNIPWFTNCQVSTYGFSRDALQYMRSYSTNRQERVEQIAILALGWILAHGQTLGQNSSRLNIRTIVILRLNQWYFSFCLKFTFK